MKTILLIFAYSLLLLPCLLVLNESESFVPNLIGLTYMIALVSYIKHNKKIAIALKKLAARLNKGDSKFI